MRISDGSSDVCSSDLPGEGDHLVAAAAAHPPVAGGAQDAAARAYGGGVPLDGPSPHAGDRLRDRVDAAVGAHAVDEDDVRAMHLQDRLQLVGDDRSVV